MLGALDRRGGMREHAGELAGYSRRRDRDDAPRSTGLDNRSDGHVIASVDTRRGVGPDRHGGPG